MLVDNLMVKGTLKSIRKSCEPEKSLTSGRKKKKKKKKVITLTTLVGSKSHMRHLQVC